MGLGPSSPDPTLEAELKATLPSKIKEAAAVIQDSDVLLLLTGAGFSADSGLAVYADVAKVPAFQQRELEYHDICKPHWLLDDPGLFWGFWGGCFNDYRLTQPHEGYRILRRWRDRFFGRGTEVSEWLKTKQTEVSAATAGMKEEPYAVLGAAGAFYVFTSNVDAHSFDVFEPEEVRECHGNTELFQCSENCNGMFGDVWRAPGPEHGDLRFSVDLTSMIAQPGTTLYTVDSPSLSPADEEKHQLEKREVALYGRLHRLDVEGKGDVDDALDAGHVTSVPPAQKQAISLDFPSAPTDMPNYMSSTVVRQDGIYDAPKKSTGISSRPTIGATIGTRRSAPLCKWPMQQPPPAEAFPPDAFPKCPHCSAAARPAILMFDDDAFEDQHAQRQRFDNWKHAVHSLSRTKLENGDKLKVALLEIGAGGNVTTVRNEAEELGRTLSKAGAGCTLIRINPDLPLCDNDKEFYRYGAKFVSVMCTGLAALEMIDNHMTIGPDGNS